LTASLVSREAAHPGEVPEARGKTLVFAPTYNERTSIVPLLDTILALPQRPDILIVDDSSSDGTTEYVAARARGEPRLKLVVRAGKQGIGSAHKAGWLFARQNGYARLVTMDADLSHDPNDIPRLLAALDAGADVAIGSRFAAGGQLDYAGWRRTVSIGANALAGLLLRLGIKEHTTSFRAAWLTRVPVGLVESITNNNYSFFLSCMVALSRSGLRIVEVPIRFHNRHGGVSKIPPAAVLRGLVNLLQLTFDRRWPRAEDIERSRASIEAQIAVHSDR
jgi:dolichol-phosphate mannosyltransferase